MIPRTYKEPISEDIKLQHRQDRVDSTHMVAEISDGAVTENLFVNDQYDQTRRTLATKEYLYDAGGLLGSKAAGALKHVSWNSYFFSGRAFEGASTTELGDLASSFSLSGFRHKVSKAHHG